MLFVENYWKVTDNLGTVILRINPSRSFFTPAQDRSFFIYVINFVIANGKTKFHSRAYSAYRNKEKRNYLKNKKKRTPS